MADLHFELVTPTSWCCRGRPHGRRPGTEGDFGVMAGHAPYMSVLKDGEVAVYRTRRRRARADRGQRRLCRSRRQRPDHPRESAGEAPPASRSARPERAFRGPIAAVSFSKTFAPIHHPDFPRKTGSEMNAFGKRGGLSGRAAAEFRRCQADEGPAPRRQGVRERRRRPVPADRGTRRLGRSDGRSPRPAARWTASTPARTAAAKPRAARPKASRPRFTGSRSRCSRACSSASTPKPRQRSARTSWPRNSGRSSARCSPS